MTDTPLIDELDIINAFAQAIRRVDGQHTLGAAALAEAVLPEVRKAQAAAIRNIATKSVFSADVNDSLEDEANKLDPTSRTETRRDLLRQLTQSSQEDSLGGYR